MEELIRQKFRQNEKLRGKLLNDGYQNYYEMTTDKYWATGSRLPRDYEKINTGTLTGENKVGIILAKIKREIQDELERAARTNGPVNRASLTD